MRLHSLAFAGYRSFAARSPAAVDRPLQHIQLAPLTILLGKNNSGKSTVARLLHHVLIALGAEGRDPFPMTDGQHTFGTKFRDVQHCGNFFNPIDLDIELGLSAGPRTRLLAQLAQAGELADDHPPSIQKWNFGGKSYVAGEVSSRGLLPDQPYAKVWREGARQLLNASCHLGPIRDPVEGTYSFDPLGPGSQLPNTNAAIAHMLLSDGELRMAVEDWMATNLEGWRVDVQQTLGDLKLLARRHGRESNLADSGQGIQQVLPVVVLCCWRRLGRGQVPFLDLIEQPELHLHDAAHAPIGDLLLSAVAGGHGNIVVETHSESLVLRIRRRIAEGLSPDNVAIVYVDDVKEGSQLRPILLSHNGEVDWWPEGIFSEAFLEVKAIRRAQRRHGEK